MAETGDGRQVAREAFTPFLTTNDEVDKNLKKHLEDLGVDNSGGLHSVIAREFPGGTGIPVLENGKTVSKTLEELVKHGDGKRQVPYFLDKDKQLVLGKRKERPLSYPPGAPKREFRPPPLDQVKPVVRGKQQHGSMMGSMRRRSAALERAPQSRGAVDRAVLGSDQAQGQGRAVLWSVARRAQHGSDRLCPVRPPPAGAAQRGGWPRAATASPARGGVPGAVPGDDARGGALLCVGSAPCMRARAMAAASACLFSNAPGDDG